MPADRKKRRGRPPKETSPGKSHFSKRVQNYNLKAAWKLNFHSLSFVLPNLIRLIFFFKFYLESNPTQNVTSEEETRRINFETLTRDDLDCPICIDLVNEPVRLKCDHLLCRECFERLLELSARKCPKCRRWIGGTRRIADWLDSRLWQFIRKKFHSQYQTMDEQIKSDRKLALSIARQQRRESYFRRSHYVLRSFGTSRMDTSIAPSDPNSSQQKVIFCQLN